MFGVVRAVGVILVAVDVELGVIIVVAANGVIEVVVVVYCSLFSSCGCCS